MKDTEVPATEVKRPPFFYVNHWGNGDVDVSIFRPRGDAAPHRDYRLTPASIERLQRVLGSCHCKPFYYGLTDQHMGIGLRWKAGR